MAGMACAQRLAAAGWGVRMFDKARAPGGRMATRRVILPDGREIRFDHGAQYVDAVAPDFIALCDRLERKGVATQYPWPIFGSPYCDTPSTKRFVGAPGMNAMPKALAKDFDVVCTRQVTALARSAEGWRLMFAGGASEGGFAAVAIAVPAEQAAPLVTVVSAAFTKEAANARTAPCWAGLLAFEGGGEPAFGALQIDDGGPLAWLARTADGQGWVAHASPAWSKANLEVDAEVVARDLEAAARRLLQGVGATLHAQAHRWRFAQVETAAKTPFAWDETLALGLCGDWRLGRGVESAWRSGDLLGGAMATAGLGRRGRPRTTARSHAG